MKKILVIGIISMFLLISLTTVSAVENNENTIKETFETFVKEPINPMPVGDIIIDPIYFKTWYNQSFNVAEGYKSTIHNGCLYVAVALFVLTETGAITDPHVGILKFQMSDGNLIKSLTLCEGYTCDIVSYSNFIYILTDSTLSKLDTNLNIIKTQVLPQIDGSYLAHGMKAGNDGIYVSGETKFYGKNDNDVFLAKFDADLNPVWVGNHLIYVFWDSEGEDMLFSGSIAVYNNYVYIAGLTAIDNSSYVFLLKYDANGNLIKEKIGEETRVGVDSIEAHDGKIYVCSSVHTLLLGNDIIISAYNTDFNLNWEKRFREAPSLLYMESGSDMIVVDDSLYVCGSFVKIDFIHQKLYLGGFILKCDINTGKKIWSKLSDKCTMFDSVCADADGYLYITGGVWEDSQEKVFVMKLNGPPNPPNIDGPRIGEEGKEYEYTFVTTDSENNNIFYFIDWGDGTTSDWIGPYASGVTVSAKHMWTTGGAYQIKVKAKDIHDAESDWGTFAVAMPLDLVGSQQSSSTPQTQTSTQPSVTTTQQSASTSMPTSSASTTSASTTTTATSTATTSKSSLSTLR